MKSDLEKIKFTLWFFAYGFLNYVAGTFREETFFPYKWYPSIFIWAAIAACAYLAAYCAGVFSKED